MSELYDSIPPERRWQYYQNAYEAVRKATDPVLMELGSLAVTEAEQITALDAEAHSLGNEASTYVQENDLGKKFMEEIEKPRESGIAEQAQKFLDINSAFEEAAKNRQSLKYPDFRKFATLEEAERAAAALDVEQQISTGSDEDIRKLTINKNEFPDQPPEHQ